MAAGRFDFDKLLLRQFVFWTLWDCYFRIVVSIENLLRSDFLALVPKQSRGIGVPTSAKGKKNVSVTEVRFSYLPCVRLWLITEIIQFSNEKSSFIV